jgi:lipopolysaccharide transport system ATP-binding protein
VDFEVQHGDVLGIIGRNGAGKSTLLKILSRITAPTRGRVTVQGRMASLLEVGTGFHPELSGRENIYLNGAILGMSRADIRSKFDAIVEFAEIKKFIDTPVKRYSSGMYVRLAFSVAAHMDPDILVIDEVLAVGDADFQKKCLGKLEDNHSQGRTVLVVSHNIPMIMQLCNKALWLDQGCVMQQGSIQEVAASYLSLKRMSASTWVPESQDSEVFNYREVSVIAPQGGTPDAIAASQGFEVEFRYSVRMEGLRGRIALQIRNQDDVPIFSSASTDSKSILNGRLEVGDHVDTCKVPGNLLTPGRYYLTISQPTGAGDAILENICSFRIDSGDSLVIKDGRQGVIAPRLDWSSRKMNGVVS